MIKAIEYIYTVEEVASQTGYSVGTVKDFTSQGIAPKPRQWLDQAVGRKGLYPVETIEMLKHYRQLRSLGRSKAWVKARMSERMQEFNQRFQLQAEQEEATICQ